MARLRTRKHKVVLNRSVGGDIGINVLLILMGAFMFLPMLYVIMQSLKPLDELWMFPPRFYVVSPTLKNFSDLFKLMSTSWVPFSRYIFNTVFIAAVGTALTVVFSAMAAFVLSKTDIKYKGIIFTVIQFALLFNTYTLAIPQYIIYSQLRVINTYFVYLFPTLASSMGVFLMKQYMDGYVPDALIEAAHIDGADWFRIFSRIIIPIIKPCVLTLTLFTFLGLWNVQSVGTIFSEQLKTLPTVMSTIAAGGLARTGSSMATSVIMMIPPVLVYLISQSSIKETMSSAGIK